MKIIVCEKKKRLKIKLLKLSCLCHSVCRIFEKNLILIEKTCCMVWNWQNRRATGYDKNWRGFCFHGPANPEKRMTSEVKNKEIEKTTLCFVASATLKTSDPIQFRKKNHCNENIILSSLFYTTFIENRRLPPKRRVLKD